MPPLRTQERRRAPKPKAIRMGRDTSPKSQELLKLSESTYVQFEKRLVEGFVLSGEVKTPSASF